MFIRLKDLSHMNSQQIENEINLSFQSHFNIPCPRLQWDAMDINIVSTVRSYNSAFSIFRIILNL